MPDSQNPDHVRKIISEFQLKGQNLVPTVTGEIVPTVLVADLTAESRASDRLAWAGLIGAASGAGKQNVFVLENPAGTAVLAILEGLYLEGLVAGVFAIRLINAVAGAGTDGQWRDGRLQGEPACKVVRSTPATIVLTAPQFTCGARNTDIPSRIDLNIIIPPGWYVQALQEEANDTALATFFWRERDILPGD